MLWIYEFIHLSTYPQYFEVIHNSNLHQDVHQDVINILNVLKPLILLGLWHFCLKKIQDVGTFYYYR